MSGSSPFGGGSFGASATDVAALSFAIDSSQVVTAAQSLDQLQKSSDQVTQSYDRLGERSQRFIAVARDMGESISQMRRQFVDTTQSLDGMLASLDQARAKLDGTATSFAALADATGHVAALGSSFGVTSAALEQFSAQSTMLGLSAGQTTLALQRITEALQNQTLAGQQVRQEIQGLGVDLAGLGANDASGVLATVVARLRQSQDGLGKYQTESSILGVSDPNTLSGLNNSNYVSIDQRREFGYRQAAQKQIGATTDLVARDERQIATDDAQYRDLSGEYNLDRYGNAFSGLSSNQRGRLASQLGLPSDDQFTGQDDRLTALRYLQANPDSEFAQAALRPSARAGEAYRNSYVGGALRHLNDGTFSSNEADIQDQYDLNTRRSRGFLGLNVGNFFGEQGSEIANLFNRYTPTPNDGDTRPIDGDTKLRNDQAAAATLAGFGDSGLNDYQALGAQLRKLQDPATLKTFQDTYASIGINGDDLYGQAVSKLQRQQQQSIVPGAADQDAANQQAYLLNIPESQRAQAQALLQFEQKSGVDSKALYDGSAPISPADALNLGGTGGGGGPGILQDKLRDAFLKLFQSQASNAATELLQELDKKNTQAQGVLSATGAAGSDPVALATARFQATTLNAYNNLPALTRQGLPYDQYRQREVTENYIAGHQQVQGGFQEAQQNALAASRREGEAQLGQNDGGDLERNIDLQKQYAVALADAAIKGPEAVASLRKVIDGIADLQRQASYSNFEAKNFGQAGSEQLQAQFTQQIAAAPVGQRAYLSGVAGIVSQSGFNPVLQRHNDLSQSDLAVYQGLQQQGVLDPSLFGVATTIPRLEGATDRPDLPLLQQFGLTQGALADLSKSGYTVDPTSRASVIGGSARYLQMTSQAYPGNPLAAGLAYNTGVNAPGLKQFAASGDVDQSGLTTDQRTYAQGLGAYSPQELEAAAANDPALSARLAALKSTQSAGYTRQIADLSSTAAPRTSIEAQLLQLLGTGQTGQAQLLQAGVNTAPGTPVGSYEAQQRVLDTQRGFAEQGARNSAQTQQEIEDNTKLAQAYLAGGDAVEKLNAQMQAHKEVLQGTISPAQENQRTQELLNKSYSDGTAELAQMQQKIDQDQQVTDYTASLGIKDQYSRSAAISQFQYISTYNNKNPGTANDPATQANLQAQAQQIQQQKDLQQSTDAVNQAFDQMGKSIFSTFENAAFSGQRFKRTLGELFESISQIILKLTIEKPLENFFTNTVGGWFGTSLNGVASQGAGSAVSGAAGAASSASGAGGGFFDFVGNLFAASGAVYGPSGNIKYHASGGVLPGPTPFMDAGGGSNVAGEAGPEAIMPLQVLPNGSLGIAASGGGGSSIYVHTPITISGGGSGPGGTLDPSQARAIQMQIQKSVQEGVKAVILQQQRPGGQLYGTGMTSTSN